MYHCMLTQEISRVSRRCAAEYQCVIEACSAQGVLCMFLCSVVFGGSLSS